MKKLGDKKCKINLIKRKKCNNFKMKMMKRMKRKKKNSVVLTKMVNQEDVKMLKKKNQKDHLSAINQNGL